MFLFLSWNHEDANIDFCLVFSFFLNIFVLYVSGGGFVDILCGNLFLFAFLRKRVFLLPTTIKLKNSFLLFSFWLSFHFEKKRICWCLKKSYFFQSRQDYDWFMISSEWGIEWGSRHHIFCNNCSKNLHFFFHILSWKKIESQFSHGYN